ncbi:MAG: helix-turn-helix domain-containing protein [Rubrivivax sp.]|nr:helix-turn-helix domain-containing protein [Rubrivivax sp.]
MTDTQPGSPSAGALLRAAREKQGLHIAALAAAIKVAPRKLDALENDRWQDLPDATFTRALAQTVCRTLKIDAQPVLALLPAAAALPLEPLGNGMNQPFRDRPVRDGPGFGTAAIRPMVWAAAVLMVAALVVYFVPPDLWTARPPAAVASTPAMPAAASAASAVSPGLPASAVAASSAALPASAVAAVDAGASVPGAAASSSGAVATAAPLADAPPATAGETVFSAPPAAAASAPAAAGLVQLSSSEASWVDVRDGRGIVLLSRTVQPGESVGLNGSLPIRMTIGNASGTQVRFRGQLVDLAPRTRENVARVELQ